MANGSRQNTDGADSGDDLLMKAFVRRDLYTALFAIGALIVLILAYVPIIRAHQRWEGEIYWLSTWSPGRASTPGQPRFPAPMGNACHAPDIPSALNAQYCGYIGSAPAQCPGLLLYILMR
jgi:hypothetical protein